MLTTQFTGNKRHLITGDGEMGELIRNFNWSNTALGSFEKWPQSLYTAVNLCLNSRFPMVLWWGKDLVKIYNDAYSIMLGTKHPHALGATGKEVWPEIWHIIGPMLESVLQTGKATWSDNQLLLLHRNGFTEECYFTFSYSPVYGENDKVEGVFCAVTETTDAVTVERQLQTLTNLGKNILNLTGDLEVYQKSIEVIKQNPRDFPFALIYEVSRDGKKLSLADKTSEDLGLFFPYEIDLDKHASQFHGLADVAKGNAPVIADDLMQRFGNLPTGAWDSAIHTAFVLPVAHSQQKIPYAILKIGINPYRILNDKYQNFFKLIADQIGSGINNSRIFETERKRTSVLEELDKAKTVFFSNISHEFRTPLTLMLGNLEELINSPEHRLSSSEKQSIETTHRNAMRLLKLVNTLLDFSRIESGRITAHYSLTDIVPFTASLAGNFRSTIEKAGLALEVKTQAIKEQVYVDKQMWEKIIFNLLSNAFKYTLKGKITVALFAQNNHVILEVQDTGVGIPQNELQRIFERFYRVQHVTGRTYEGTGIGLSLTHELVRLHGGTISVESGEGKGSTFRVSIPSGKAHLPVSQVNNIRQDIEDIISDSYIKDSFALQENLKPKTNTATGAENINSNTPAVLIVDDNADMREYLQSLLEKKYRVFTAGNGLEALDIMKDKKPQLVLSDIMMPVMDGIRLVEEIKQNRQTEHIPVMLITARAGEESKIEGYETGADDYLVKPFSAKELLARVHAQIRIAQTRKHVEHQLNSLFEQAPVAIAIMRGPDFTVEIINEMALEIIGKPKAQLLNKPLFEVIPEVKEQGFEAIFKSVFKTGKRIVIEEMEAHILRNENLDAVFVKLVIEPFREENGSISGIMAAAYDITEHVTARKKIEVSELRYRRLIQGISVALYTCDKEGRILLYNQAAVELWGREPKVGTELWCGSWKIYQTNGELLPLDKCPMALVLKYGRVETFEIIIERPDGSRRHVLPYPQPILNDKDEITGAINLLLDITENTKIQKALQVSEERFSNIISQVGAGIAQTDITGKFIAVNEQYCHLVGRSEQELLALRIEDVTHPDDREQNILLLKRCATEGKSFTMEKRYLRPDGSVVWVNNSVSLIKGSDNLSFLTAVSIDITEAKKMEARLIESENRFRSMSDTIPVIIWIADNNGNCIYLNKQWYDYTGQTPQNALGDGWLEAVHPAEREITTGAFFDAKPKEIPFVLEFRLRDEDGNYRWFLNSGLPNYNEDGDPEGYIGSCTDITDNKKLSQQKDEFMSIVSHELKTPVTSLKAFTQLLEMKFSTAGDEASSAIMRRMDLQITKLNTLISDLLDITRLDEGKLSLKAEVFSFTELVNETVEDVQRIASTHTMITEIFFNCLLTGDRDRIGQVLTNFITNAIKYSPKADKIIVSVTLQNDSVICAVQDFGIGINKKNQSRIFSRFYRVEGEKFDTFPGLGLGLYISAEIIRKQSGKIWFESEPGKGSIFYFSLPVNKA
ncbi:PAS domain S-box protein [Agriterribacter sp.]|uniref:PAS domain S-box protein n=1 Tax=Agriterribacter sp. TaxID=2821509 RepID=UPI002BE59A08|nr:PAS domain S-box protein [Agriterribacter sp.]HRO48125.1 PAS domain S-box protein [Agriterribacter sp.]HRQ19126.1 PAS domain S-box protein [Agriterribacter sp.]